MIAAKVGHGYILGLRVAADLTNNGIVPKLSIAYTNHPPSHPSRGSMSVIACLRQFANQQIAHRLPQTTKAQSYNRISGRVFGYRHSLAKPSFTYAHLWLWVLPYPFFGPALGFSNLRTRHLLCRPLHVPLGV